jgi:predicted regulator of Ras-like GTPase activity (Roadblock/LC7/MglB family)
MNRLAHRDPVIVSNGTVALEEMRGLCHSLLHAALLTDDGFEVARLPGSTTDTNRFASMASSMQALCDAVARELSMGASEYIIIASEDGYVIQLRVPEHEIVLSARFGNDETVGKALSIARLTAGKVSAFLSERAA